MVKPQLLPLGSFVWGVVLVAVAKNDKNVWGLNHLFPVPHLGGEKHRSQKKVGGQMAPF